MTTETARTTTLEPIIAIGDALIDLLQLPSDSPTSAPQWLAHVGGAPANVAAGIAKLGGQAGFAGAVGQDHFGQLISKTLADLGVDIQHLVHTTRAPTTLALVNTEAETGERRFAFYHRETAYHYYSAANWQSSTSSAPTTTASSAIGGLHIVSNSLTIPQLRQAVDQAIADNHDQKGLLSFDINYRSGFWDGDEATAKAVIIDYMSRAHILKFSDEELSWLRGQLSSEDFFRQCFDRAPQLALIAVTLGGEGAQIITPTQRITVDSPKVTPVDTTGAGDAFMAGLRYQLQQVKIDGPGLPAYVADLWALESAVSFACACGALAVTRQGAIPALPTVAEVEQLRLSGA